MSKYNIRIHWNSLLFNHSFWGGVCIGKMEFNEVLQFVLNFVMSDNFFLLIWNQLRGNCFINLIIKSFYKLSLLWVLINRSFSTGLNLCPLDNTIGFPNTYQPDIKWIIRWTARTIKLLNRPGAGRHSILRLLYWGPLFRRNQSRDDRYWLEDDLKGQPFKP